MNNKCNSLEYQLEHMSVDTHVKPTHYMNRLLNQENIYEKEIQLGINHRNIWIKLVFRIKLFLKSL